MYVLAVLVALVPCVFGVVPFTWRDCSKYFHLSFIFKLLYLFLKGEETRHKMGIIFKTYSREASDAGEFHLKTKSRDFRVIFDEK